MDLENFLEKKKILNMLPQQEFLSCVPCFTLACLIIHYEVRTIVNTPNGLQPKTNAFSLGLMTSCVFSAISVKLGS